MNKFKTPSRRGFLAGGTALLAAPAILRGTRAYAQTPTLKVGHVSPRTGPLAGFAEADDYVLAAVADAFAGGIENNGKTWNIEIISKDSQSNPNRAAEVAADLILGDEVDIIVAASTPDTVNPVSDQAEINEVPCITTDCPWQPYFFGRNGVPGEGFASTYHFFWGLDEALRTFVGLWNTIETNKKVGMLFPQNIDGETWGNEDYGLPSPTREAGFEVVKPGYFQPRTNDFTAQISTFKNEGCDIVGGIAFTDDFKTFVNQGNQQGYHPRAMTMAAALLFPSAVEAMGDLGNGMSSEVWWTPAFPFKSSLTGQVSRDIADEWEAETNRQWTQPLGYSHAIWEVAIDALKRSGNPLDKTAVRDAIKATNLNTLIGPVNFSTGPHPNVSTTPIFGGQWVPGEKWMYDLKIVDNTVNQLFEPEQKMKILPWAM